PPSSESSEYAPAPPAICNKPTAHALPHKRSTAKKNPDPISLKPLSSSASARTWQSTLPHKPAPSPSAIPPASAYCVPSPAHPSSPLLFFESPQQRQSNRD